jgi:hypothetical protein
MSPRPKIEETYSKGKDVLNFVVYERTDRTGDDEVLQHKLLGTVETAHITLHPGGEVNLRVTRAKEHVVNAVWTDLDGYEPSPSPRLKKFLMSVRPKLPVV